MEELKFSAAIPRYLLGLVLRRIAPSILWSGMSCLYKNDSTIPEIPGEEWVRIRTRYGGICGSDHSTIHLETSPYYSALTSFPFTFGHENVGTIDRRGEKVEGWQPGERVVVEPTLWCKPRGFQDLCPYCARGEINRCERISQGKVSPGLMIGACRDTGGSWSSHFLAHESQLYHLPDEINDENAVMVEPFAVGLHAALMLTPSSQERILIIGGGCIGLCTLAGLRAIGCQAEITVLSRYDFQGHAALQLGADRVILTKGKDYYPELAHVFAGELISPMIGKRVMIGGPDVIFECTGSAKALDDAFRFTRNGGRVILVGIPGSPKNVDWTAIFIQELKVQASYIYHHAEEYEGRRWKTYDLALDFMKRGKVDLSWMVTHRFDIREYKQAFELLEKRGESHLIKAVFDFQ